MLLHFWASLFFFSFFLLDFVPYLNTDQPIQPNTFHLHTEELQAGKTAINKKQINKKLKWTDKQHEEGKISNIHALTVSGGNN